MNDLTQLLIDRQEVTGFPVTLRVIAAHKSGGGFIEMEVGSE